MGLGNRERRNYLKLSKGKLRMFVKEGTPGAVKVPVTDDAGNVTHYNHELQWDNISGKVMAAKIMANGASDKYPDNFCLFMDDEYGEHYIVQVSTKSGLYTKLLNKLSNPAIDWNKPIKLEAYYFESENRAAVVVIQDGQKIEPLFTKENPGAMPKFPENVVDSNGKIINKDKWEMYLIELRVFLSDYFFGHVKIDPFANVQQNEEDDGRPPSDYIPAPEPKTMPSTTKEEGDDLPF